MIEWGRALVKELAARRCIVFLGSGASASCQPSVLPNEVPPTWEKLLERLKRRMKGTPEEKSLVESLVKDRKYLDAAEVIMSCINRADYVDEMKEIFEYPKYKKSLIHEAVYSLDPKVVVTTNFDTIYDEYCSSGESSYGYSILNYTNTESIVPALRSSARCVLKAHGCIKYPETMILNKSEFFSGRQKFPYFFKVLDSLFITNTILFIGYSLNDPDIQITLENANIAAPSSHRHYFVTEKGTPAAIRRSWEKTYNLDFIEFEKGHYDALNESMADLAAAVSALREQNSFI